MTLEADLYTALKGLVGNRVAPNNFPQNRALTWPAIRFTIVNAAPIADVCGDGDDDTAEVSVQLDVVAATFDAARALRLSVMAEMRSFAPPAILQSSFSEFDPETSTQREILTYTFHGSSP